MIGWIGRLYRWILCARGFHAYYSLADREETMLLPEPGANCYAMKKARALKIRMVHP